MVQLGLLARALQWVDSFYGLQMQNKQTSGSWLSPSPQIVSETSRASVSLYAACVLWESDVAKFNGHKLLGAFARGAPGASLQLALGTAQVVPVKSPVAAISR